MSCFNKGNLLTYLLIPLNLVNPRCRKRSVAEFMQESIVCLVRVQCRRKESSRSLSHLMMSFLFYVDAEIPAIGVYDLLKAAHIMNDTQSAEVWSKHPDVARQASFSENIFVTGQPQSIPSGVTSSPADDNAPAPCVTDDTQPSMQKDTSLTVPGVPTH